MKHKNMVLAASGVSVMQYRTPLAPAPCHMSALIFCKVRFRDPDEKRMQAKLQKKGCLLQCLQFSKRTEPPTSKVLRYVCPTPRKERKPASA